MGNHVGRVVEEFGDVDDPDGYTFWNATLEQFSVCCQRCRKPNRGATVVGQWKPRINTPDNKAERIWKKHVRQKH